MSASLKKKFLIFAVPAHPDQIFHQDCEFCEQPLKTGIFVIVIQVQYLGYKASLFSACKTKCPCCDWENTIIDVFSDEHEVNAEMHLLQEEILSNEGLMTRVIIPDISQKDLDEIFES